MNEFYDFLYCEKIYWPACTSFQTFYWTINTPLFIFISYAGQKYILFIFITPVEKKH